MLELHEDLAAALSPVAFARQLGFSKLDDWQKSFLMTTVNRRVCFNICRQAGKTTMAAVIFLHFALTHPDALILIVSPQPTPKSGNAVKNQTIL